jgi:YafQ family addiction module toxin component
VYDLAIKPEADKIFRKLSRKNQKQLQIVNGKVLEIRQNPNHNYKFLSTPLDGYNRVHIDAHFVLVFRISHEKKLVDIYYFAHHDKVYLWRPDEEDSNT